MHVLRPEQLALLAKRFPYFHEERTAPLFHDEQPKGGEKTVKDQGKFPAIRMATGDWWYPDKERRPVNTKTGAPMKSQGIGGLRKLLVHPRCREAEEVTIVEGEGHAVALASVGAQAVIAAGGTNNLARDSAKAAPLRRAAFEKKQVRLLFDPDKAGKAAVSKAAQTVLDSGAERVAIILEEDLPTEWVPGMDVEDWLATFTEVETALGAFYTMVGAVTWHTEAPAADGKDEDKLDTHRVQSERLHVGKHTALVVMVYDDAKQEARLAVFGPEGLGFDGELVGADAAKQLGKYTDQHTLEDAVPHAWQILESWRYRDVLYKPDVSDAVMHYLHHHTLILPPPPAAEAPSSEELWGKVRAFMQRWLVLDLAEYDVLVCYVFLSYRLEDAGFECTPYLRFYGPTGMGKGRALDVMRVLCWRTFTTLPTTDNLHRLVSYFGDATLVMDEFHLERGKTRESMERLMDMLNLGYKRGQGVTRFQDGKHGQQWEMRHFDLFGAKVFAGYGHDQHEALARRTINIQMRPRKLPKKLPQLALPDEFYEEARELRAQLLAWRAKKLMLGKPSPMSPKALRLLQAVGPSVGQVFWPLVEMVPEGLEAEMQNVLAAAEHRGQASHEARLVSEEGYLLECLLRASLAFPPDSEGARFVPADAVYNLAQETGQARWSRKDEMAKKLRGLGIAHARRLATTPDGQRAKVGGFLVSTEDQELVELCERYEVELAQLVQQHEAGL